MNFHLSPNMSVVLMSRRQGAPYADEVVDAGQTLIYEGHDEPRQQGGPDPKSLDQPLRTPGGGLTQNGLFQQAAQAFRNGQAEAELVRVYEKIKQGIWVYNGIFRLVNAEVVKSGHRKVLKFRLELTDMEDDGAAPVGSTELTHTRMIPSWVKLAVWKRDGGKCMKCGRTDNLHFDHVIPFSREGTSLLPENIQLLCARHNLEKRAKIE
jgi:hypothetical protein